LRLEVPNAYLCTHIKFLAQSQDKISVTVNFPEVSATFRPFCTTLTCLKAPFLDPWSCGRISTILVPSDEKRGGVKRSTQPDGSCRDSSCNSTQINATTLFQECSITKVPQVIKIKPEIITRLIVVHLFL